MNRYGPQAITPYVDNDYVNAKLDGFSEATARARTDYLKQQWVRTLKQTWPPKGQAETAHTNFPPETEVEIRRHRPNRVGLGARKER